jgi:hypothetical protein
MQLRVAVVSLVLAAGSLGTATANAQGLNHFMCYGVQAQPFPDVKNIPVTDRFGSVNRDVKATERFCNPASKNGEDPTAITDPDHLTGYDTRPTKRSTRFDGVEGVVIANQFGTSTVDVIRPAELLVPTAKSETEQPPELTPSIDNFQCYVVQGGQRRVKGVTVEDQFGELRVDIKRPHRLCVAADVDDGGFLDQNAALLCYEVRAKPPFHRKDPIFIDNRFGTSFGRRGNFLGRAAELCVPTIVNPGAPTVTPIATASPTPGETPTATAGAGTPTATETGGETPTATPTEAATPTATVDGGTPTAVEGTATPTATAEGATPTATIEGPTPTATPTADVATATPTEAATPTATATAEVPTPTATATAEPAGCGNGVVDEGEDCDPPGSASCTNAGNGLEVCSATCLCECPALIDLEGQAESPDSLLDTGWTGIAHDNRIVSDGTVTVAIDECDSPDESRPCGVCTFTGPVPNVDAGTGQIDAQRCVNDTSVRCTDDAGCPGSTCAFFFGAPLPLSSGGVATCVTNQIVGTITGTANIETGTAASELALTSRVFNGILTAQPCPQCNGDPTPNDGVQDGSCLGGQRPGADCDANGTSPIPSFGTTSLDCPPSTGAQIAALPIDLSNSTGTQTRTLSADSPNCRAAGFTALECFCDTCDNLAATPCSSNADCTAVGATTCGGRRCLPGSGALTGNPCAVNADCSPGFCGVPGQPSAPNACSDGVCTPGADNEGTCEAGPIDQTCTIETFRSCSSDAECPATGDTCGSRLRECFIDNGTIGGSVTATGEPDPPINDVSEPVLAALFCIGPTGAGAVNSVAGLPGLGRLTLRGTARGLPTTP